MSNEKSEQYERETALHGVVVAIERKAYGQGKQLAEILIKCDTGWKDRPEESVYPVTIFDKGLTDPAFQLTVGDTVDVVARVGAREYKGRWYVGLVYKSATVVNRPGVQAGEHPLGEAAGGAVEPAADDNDAMPF